MKIIPEPERMDARAPLVLLAFSLAIIVLGVLATVLLRSADRRPAPAGGLALTPPAGLAVQEVGTEPVQASWLFDPHGAAPSTRALPAELKGYGWVDREHGLVRIPIARAKQLYLQQFELERRGSARPLTVPARHEGSR